MRGPHVARRRWRDPKTGAWKTSPWFFLFYSERLPDGSRRKVVKRTDPPTDSKRVATDQLHAALSGANPTGSASIAVVLDRYDAHLRLLSPSTYRDKKSWIRWWRARFAAEPFSPRAVETALAELARDHAEGTVTSYLAVLRAAVSLAVRDRVLGENPLVGLRTSYGYPERHVVWTDEELEKVLAEVPSWMGPFLRFLRLSGVRVGDALALRWDQVDGGRLRLRQGKTGEPLDVPLPAAAVALLEALPRQGSLVWPAGEKRAPGGARPGGGGPEKPRRYDRVLHTLRAAMKRAKVTGRTIHDLRRTRATELLERGVSLEVIAALLGQRTTRVAGRYARARFDALKAVVDPPAAPRS